MRRADVDWIRALDWGYNAPGVCLWIACLLDGHYHVEHEYKFRETIAADVARSIVEETAALGIRAVRYTAADPAMWQRQAQFGEAIAETFGRHGCPLTPAKHERVNGWQRVHALLKTAPDGAPWLTIAPSCRYLLRTIPAAVQDEKNPEDVDTTCDDHGLDALRYFAMSRPMPTGASTPRPMPVGAVGHLLTEVRTPVRSVVGSSLVRRSA